MKKMISALLSTIIVTLAIAGSAAAQGGDKDIAFIPAKNHAAYVAFLNQSSYTYDNAGIAGNGRATKTDASTKAAKANMKAVKANGKAVRAFGNSYKNAGEAHWSIGENAMIATFSKDDVKTDVVYNKKGNWFHSLTYYPGDKTPKDIVETIDYTYPKDDIMLAVKVEEGHITFYIVQLEGKTTLKKVTVYNGEVNTIEEYTKAN